MQVWWGAGVVGCRCDLVKVWCGAIVVQVGCICGAGGVVQVQVQVQVQAQVQMATQVLRDAPWGEDGGHTGAAGEDEPYRPPSLGYLGTWYLGWVPGTWKLLLGCN